MERSEADLAQQLAKLTTWISQTAKKANGLLIPISGGSDSALCFWACARVFPDKTLGVHVGKNLPCKKWFESVGKIKLIKSPATKSKENRQAEALRWASLMCLSLHDNRWLVGSRNRTEETFGTYSLASRIATYLPLAGIWKTDVMDLCELIDVPRKILESSRKEDPDCGRPRELAEIPLELIDIFLKVKTGKFGRQQLRHLTAAQIDYLQNIYDANLFKQNLPLKGDLT